MTITVAICTWNRCGLLRATLEQMTRLVSPVDARWEILIVDNNCTDETPQVVESFEGRLPIRMIREWNPGKAHAVNRALREADDLVLFTDDDVLVDEAWLTRFAGAACRFPGAAAFGGAIAPWFPIPPDPDFVDAFPSLKHGFCGLDHDLEEGPLPEDKEIYGANIGFRRSALGSLEFNTALGPNPFGAGRVGDETEFVQRVRRAGGEVIWVPGMRVRHYVDPSRMTLAYLREFTDGGGRTWIRWNGVPPGRQIAGVPLWLVRKAAEAWIRSKALGLAGKRRASLHHLHRHCSLRGMIHECRAIARERHAPHATMSSSSGA
jgi:glycosyltransferase involved in cell wall biosynthesis